MQGLNSINNIFNKLSEEFYIPDNFSFDCQNCGNCCRKDTGFVLLLEKDILRICEKINISKKEFIEKYTKRDDIFLSLKEKDNLDCIFWDETTYFKGCKIYEIKPYQCTSYPYWVSVFKNRERFEKTIKNCPGFFKGNKILKKEDILEKIYLDFKERFDWFYYILSNKS
ncbi:MAG TPA: YkgJ family cysteine cluster protein [Spirochaetota bacterium]|nr:YkgJ family cysteine cluster protein [Spirochaetota bacterium]HOM38894.1 YkgJ family cysteine cluster protein [Spirochaetota bacterium]HPQ49127.1 YkgJ family cysteine cluster protein [Spirochaetota bacterium]